MSRTRPVLGSLLRFFLLYGLLMAPWPGVRDFYRDRFVGGSGFAFGLVVSRKTVAIGPNDPHVGAQDTVVEVRHPKRGPLQLKINSGEVAYLPTAILISLIVASPMSKRRRLGALVAGLVLVNVFILLRLAVMMQYVATLPMPGNPSDPVSLWIKTVSAAAIFVGVGPGFSCIVAVMIWVIVLVRKEDLEMLLPAKAA